MTDQLYCPACGPDWHGAYNLDHRCVTCGAVLRVEKVMERLKAVEEERDALAAYAEAGKGIVREWGCGEFGDVAAALQLDQWAKTQPASCLARLKAEWQAEALEEEARCVMDEAGYLETFRREVAGRLRYQARRIRRQSEAP